MEKVVANFWRGKKVFLTGHTGFKGSWLSLWLAQMGAEVTGFSLAPATEPSLFKIADLKKDLRSVEGDVRDLDQLRRAMREAKPEIVVHMAAQPLVSYSYANPVETYMTNVMGTVHVHEAARGGDGVRALLNVTTDKCYENREHLTGYREDDPLGGHDPYSSSKACSEIVTSAYRRSFGGMAVASARAGNVIGGGDWASDRLLPDVFRALTARRQAIIRHPRAVRPWQHVLDALSGYLLLIEKLFADGEKYSSAFNFAPAANDVRSVESVVKRVIELWGNGAEYRAIEDASFHEAQLLTLNCEKARTCLNWSPKWSLDEALPKIVSWYQAVQVDASQARSLMEQQIQLHQIT